MNTTHPLHRHSFSARRYIVALLALTWCQAALAEGFLKPGDRIAIVGDSITQQRKYSRFIETYLLACEPRLDVRVFQLGWSGETAQRFVARMERDLIPWKPDVVTLCYGMNDGGWRAYHDWIGREYDESMRAIVRRLEDGDATVVIGSPGVVDSDMFRWSPTEVNHKMGRLGELAREVAKDCGMPFADVHSSMMQSMTAAKAALGDDYHVAGEDGVHPAVNGHLVMAFAFLKAMGLDGDIGTVSVDYTGAATATEGHTVLRWKAGQAVILSERYPFCFWGKPNDPAGTVSILPFVPFQDDLNRFRLVVTNLPTSRAEVTWGKQMQTFTRKELNRGINLAAAFLKNPFCRSFKRVDRAVERKQLFETYWIHDKYKLTHFRLLRGGRDPNDAERRKRRWEKMLLIQTEHQRKVRSAVRPLKHRIYIRPVGLP